MTDDDLERFVDFVEETLGHSTTYYERKHLERRFNARMRRLDIDEGDWDAYLEVLRNDEDERSELLDTMSINVTEFFRNPGVWNAIRDEIRSLSSRQRRVRAWSVPCSDGREPYSLAMLAVDDDEVDELRFDVLGTDIDPRALAVAEEGLYRSSHASDIEDEIRSFDPGMLDYLERDGDEHRVAPQVRDLVSFEQHDVISGPPKTGMDLVLCRNLMIYIEERYKSSLVENLDAALAPGGRLVIGKTETLPPSIRRRYEAVDSENRIYARKDVD